jgi:hypothetical protein
MDYVPEQAHRHAISQRQTFPGAVPHTSAHISGIGGARLLYHSACPEILLRVVHVPIDEKSNDLVSVVGLRDLQ